LKTLNGDTESLSLNLLGDIIVLLSIFGEKQTTVKPYQRNADKWQKINHICQPFSEDIQDLKIFTPLAAFLGLTVAQEG
jgi:hypothetical protein